MTYHQMQNRIMKYYLKIQHTRMDILIRCMLHSDLLYQLNKENLDNLHLKK